MFIPRSVVVLWSWGVGEKIFFSLLDRKQASVF